MRLFMTWYFLFVAAIAVIAAAAEWFTVATVLIPGFWLVFTFMVLVTFLAYWFSLRGIVKGGETSIFTLMIVIGLKLFGCMGLALGYLMNFQPPQTLFIVEFFSLYFSFTAFEVCFLLRNLRDQKIIGKS